MPRLSLSALSDPKPGTTFPDPAVEGLRYRVMKSGRTYAELRWKGARGWKAEALGRVVVEDRLADLMDDWEQGDPSPTLDEVLEPWRVKAKEVRRQLRNGEDPRSGITLQGALDLHLSSKARSPRTVEEYRSKTRLHFRDWLDRPLAKLDRAAVRARHRELSASIGPYGANGALRVFRAVWNRARRQHPDLPESPTANVDWNPEERRDAAIPLALLPRWWQGVHALANPVRRDFYLTTLFTGLRRRTVDCIRREHVDLGARTLHIPRPKGGRAFKLPLSDFLYEVLALRLLSVNFMHPSSPWLFPAASKSGHLEEPKANGSWRGVPFTVHGLRNTYISAATAAGVHPYYIKLLVNHAVPKGDVTAGYLGRDVDALREPQQRNTDWLLAAVRG